MEAAKYFTESAETVFTGLGMNQGKLAPIARGVFGWAVGTGATMAFRPAVAYNQDGSTRPFSLLEPDAPDATLIPWWMPGVASGIFCSMFI